MQNHQIQAKVIYDACQRAVSILIISHQSPDGDTLGAGTALIEYLTSLGKDVYAFCTDQIPPYLQYLPYSHLYTDNTAAFDREYDVIIVVDAGSLEYAGVTQHLEKHHPKTLTINIDHHQTNPHFGDINLVITTASSTCEVIARLLKHWRLEPSQRMAQSLLTGIITDTSGLRNAATSHQTITTAADLVKAGADIQQLYRQTHQQKSINQLRLWGLALSRLKMNTHYQMAATYIRHEDIHEHELTPESLEGLANYLAVLSDARVVLVLKTEPGIIRGSFRTVFDHPDVSILAQAMGGGGHKKAAAFRISGDLQITDTGWNVV